MNLLAGLPAERVRYTQLPNDKGHNASWDVVKSKEGRMFISVCGEGEKPLSALLYEYDPRTGDIRLVFDLEKVWIVDPDQMPPSKIHTSIDFMPDGRLIMATHNTAPARGHRKWLYEQHYEDLWEGYPGSIVLIVHPDTGEVTVRGVPVPRESIYGGILGEDPRYYFFLGYMRGHFYRLDLETNEVKDYGKVAEYSSCRLVKDARGRIYGSTYTGDLWRYEPDNDRIEDLRIRFDSPHGTKYRRALIFALRTPENTLLFTNNVDGDLIELHPETLEVTRHGYIHLRPEQPRRPYLRQAIGGLAADDNFVLYYGLETYHGVDLMRLVRWDYRNGKEPENLGIVSPDGKQSQYICEMLFDDEGILHLVDVCGEYSPYVLAVDVRGLEPPGPDAEPAAIRPLEESDMHMNADRSYFMHIEADSMRVTPLHRSVGLGRANLVHLSKGEDRVCGIAGNDHPIFVSIDDKDGAVWTKAYPALGAPLGAVALPDRRIAVTTSCGHAAIFRSDGALDRMHPLPFPLRPGKPLAVVGGALILRDALTGELHLMSIGSGKIEPLEGIRLPQADAAIIPLSPQEFLYSGESNVLTSYRIDAGTTALWPIEAPYVKGRQFRAYLTGGLALEDGRVFAGTSDGMAFSIGADRARAKRYGRLFSTGCLRDFVAADERSVFAVYGGMKDAGRVVRLSDEDGLIDLGRPRVIKDNVQLVDSESEWASIHHISKIAFAGGALFVASAEALGGVIRYEWPERPKGAASG